MPCLPSATWSGCRGQREAPRSESSPRRPSTFTRARLRAFLPCCAFTRAAARGYIGRVDGANLVKLHTGEPKVSYLSYPDFESDPHPALASSMTVHLQTFRVRERDYTPSQNPPILHRKETFVASDHPLHSRFFRLTRQEESKGLYEDTTRIGTRRGWEQALSEKKLMLRGHRLLRDKVVS